MPVESLSIRQLTGLDESHLVTLPDAHRLQAAAARAFSALQEDARQAGFALAIASSYRSFARQLTIWNDKANGLRPVYDNQDRVVAIAQLPPAQRVLAILRFSALPGTSRHHWGTDLDVYDAAAVAPGYRVQLSAGEVSAGGVFDPLHCWLDARMAAGESHGFYRPYDKDRGGVAPERWHLSYAPLSYACAAQFHSDMLRVCWDCDEAVAGIVLREEIEADLQHIMSRYVTVPQDWCPVQA